MPTRPALPPPRLARAPALLLLALALAGGCAARFPVDGERARANVRHQVEAGPRIPGTPGHDAIRDWIAAELGRRGATVERHAFVDTADGRPLALTNLIGRYGPRAAGTRTIALLAHWDSRPWCDQDPDSARRNDPLPGANDGGSGVAVLLEVAAALQKRAPTVRVELVFVDGEDQARPGAPNEYCLGARAYAAQVRARPAGERPVAAFVFDMVGDRDLQIAPEVNSFERAANLASLVVEGARATGGKHFSALPKYTLVDDHIPLLEAGIPAVDIIDFDYPAWHTHLDLPDQVSAASLAEVANVALWLIYRSPLGHP
jgi:glutaminyl-peptide cyclotransferase